MFRNFEETCKKSNRFFIQTIINICKCFSRKKCILNNYYTNEINEEIEELEEYDELNLYSFLYEENNFINELINELWICTIYYNQIPSSILPMTQDDERLEIRVQEYPLTLNLLIAGESGTGKSTFINILKNRKIAYESDNGINKTNKINEYILSFKQEERKFHYKICDTCGFSIDNLELPELIEYIKRYSDESAKIKDRIHCILYFINENNNSRIYTSGVFSNFFNYIYKEKIKVIFVINFNDGNRHLCKRRLKNSFRLGFNSDQYNFFIGGNDENIIELNLKKHNGINLFGISKLMEKLENFFGNFKIDNVEGLRNMSTIEEVLVNISQNPFYSDLATIDDLTIKYISRAKKLISYSLPIIMGISFIPIPAVDDAIAISIESGLVVAIGRTFGETISTENIRRIFTELNFSSTKRVIILVGKVVLRITGVVVDILKLLPGIGTIIGGAISCGVNVASIEAVGHQAINYFTARFLANLSPERIINMVQQYNDNIDGITYIRGLFN